MHPQFTQLGSLALRAAKLSNEKHYTIKSGDTLSGISKSQDIS
ncbi:LysM peptidoglycan-binding domain-containing protein [Bacillus swezeyi]|uniref:LysM peptidoglycan-binding domain-containing protein n=1 Tax=Bacillus swezeyi TaxID=1925020 RepID=A0A5M8S004_9BACI|nr:LysM peptidoglycan-binding domain-containing protein [Bacillus swezeyi]KAA6475992.1 LysM peptidoglycan-binding domain-containing protein [Bacillus swezeyi]TYS38988.1 LysM peptidoglycan-binding domain-containing protein [Bacillus swezeyi]